jgi:hypothetical protein
MDLETIFNKRVITESSKQLYITKLKFLNDNKPLKNLNIFNNPNKILDKIKHFKKNTQRTYIISVVTLLATLKQEDKCPKKTKNMYETYLKILENFNEILQDQTEITEGTKIISNEVIKEVYENLKKNKDNSLDDFQKYLILSLYHLIPPRRNLDYQMLKYVKEYKDDMDVNYNYYDGNIICFINYKTRGKYNKQIIKLPDDLKEILDEHIKINEIKYDELILNDYKNKRKLTGTNAITLILNKIFNNNVGCSCLRRSYLTNTFSEKQQQLKSDVESMGTSLNMACNNYIKKSNIIYC